MTETTLRKKLLKREIYLRKTSQDIYIAIKNNEDTLFIHIFPNLEEAKNWYTECRKNDETYLFESEYTYTEIMDWVVYDKEERKHRVMQ